MAPYRMRSPPTTASTAGPTMRRATPPRSPPRRPGATPTYPGAHRPGAAKVVSAAAMAATARSSPPQRRRPRDEPGHAGPELGELHHRHHQNPHTDQDHRIDPQGQRPGVHIARQHPIVGDLGTHDKVANTRDPTTPQGSDPGSTGPWTLVSRTRKQDQGLLDRLRCQDPSRNIDDVVGDLCPQVGARTTAPPRGGRDQTRTNHGRLTSPRRPPRPPVRRPGAARTT